MPIPRKGRMVATFTYKVFSSCDRKVKKLSKSTYKEAQKITAFWRHRQIAVNLLKYLNFLAQKIGTRTPNFI